MIIQKINYSRNFSDKYTNSRIMLKLLPMKPNFEQCVGLPDYEKYTLFLEATLFRETEDHVALLIMFSCTYIEYKITMPINKEEIYFCLT